MPFIYDLTDTWTDAGVTYTSVKMDVTDTASDATSLLLDLLVAGSSKFSIDKNGNVTLSGTVDNVDLQTLSSTVNSLHAVASSGSYNDLTNKPSIPASIEDLNDVAAMTPGTGDVLTWSGSSWDSDTPDAVITTIGGLTDVTVTTPSTSHVLRYNGTNWENAQLGYGELSGTPPLSTVATSGSYNDLLNKPFIPADLNDLSDIVIGTAVQGEVIRYDGANWVDAQLSYNDLTNKPSIPADIGDLSDVTITSPATNQFLAYDGAGWINTTTLNTGTEDAVINGVDIGTGPGTGVENTRVGDGALSSLTTGSYNIALGTRSGESTTTQNQSSYVGAYAGRNAGGNDNTAVGYRALYSGVSASNNGWNTAIGASSLSSITTGGNNTAVGRIAGYSLTTGSDNTMVGYNAQPSSATAIHQITLGDNNGKSFRIPGSSFYINGGSESTTGTRVGVNIASPQAQLHVSGDAQVDGTITVSGTVDGRDVATDGSKLDGIEANADVTDTANVEAAGALMDSEVTNLAQVKAFDSADYATAAQGALADTAVQPSDDRFNIRILAAEETVPSGYMYTGGVLTDSQSVTYRVISKNLPSSIINSGTEGGLISFHAVGDL